eukprot:c28687_g2_i3 orf=511-2262(+)
MTAMATENSRRNPCIFIEPSLIPETAVGARRKRREIRQFKQGMANSANALRGFNNRRSRPPLSDAYCEEDDGERVRSALLESLSEGDVPIQSELRPQMKRKEIQGSSGRVQMRCGGLVRSLSFPPEGWEKGINRCILEFGKASKISAAGGIGGSCQGAASDKFGVTSRAACSGSCTTWDTRTVSDSSSTTHIPEAQDMKHEEREAQPQRDEIRKCDGRQENASLDTALSQAQGCSDSKFLKTISKPVPGSVRKSCASDGRCPPYGKLSVLGRRREMEDTVTVVPHFVALPCCAIGGCCDAAPESTSISALHFFGVYDGHGGVQASDYCEKRFHNALAEEIIAVASLGQFVDCCDTSEWASRWKRAMTACFLKIDREVGGVCPNGECNDFASSSNCCANTIAPGTVGSTAVVAVVSPRQIIVGNCGDSRAVLLRAGKAIALSRDHKPEREDERSRIEAAGGRVVNWDGYRVGGLLAMSRAIGDRFLKPYVIAEPEVTCIEQIVEDECLILASDGLWDVISNDVACEVARRCLATVRRKLESGYACHTDETPATAAAALLTKLALARGSKDNISVVVVDLKTRNQ